MENNLLNEELSIINVGLKIFQEAVVDQGAKSLHVDWHPPTEDDKTVDDLLDLLM